MWTLNRHTVPPFALRSLRPVIVYQLTAPFPSKRGNHQRQDNTESQGIKARHSQRHAQQETRVQQGIMFAYL
jgi:hypothetical protein